MQIRAAVAREPGHFSIEPVTVAEPREAELQVRLVATGLCHTDLAALDQHLPYPLPAVLGHEGAGIVERVGAGVVDLKPGDPVVLSFASCGQCAPCRSGRPAYCAQSRKLNFAPCRPDGSCTHRALGHPLSAGFFGQSSFATHAVVHERNAVRVPADLDLASLAPLGCGVQTGAGGVLNVLRPSPGSSLAVFGMGAVGLAAVMAARLAGVSRIVAIDLHASRLDLAAEFGATELLLVSPGDPPTGRRVHALVPGGVDCSVEATGMPSVMAEAVAATHRTGTALLLGLAATGAKLSLDAAMLSSGRTIRSSIEGDSVPQVFIPQLIAFHRAGRLPFDRMCRRYPFEAINEAVRDCRSGVTIKPILCM
jgi:aryl-alcohol dehydrogenase